MDRSLHIPIDLELTDGVRLLAGACGLCDGDRHYADRPRYAIVEKDGSMPPDLERNIDSPLGQDKALVFTLRLWTDWARQRSAWRPLRLAGNPDWNKEPVAELIETVCGFAGPKGKLIEAFVEVGILTIEEQSELKGLVLAGFEELNSHLLPGYKTLQQRGGHAKAAAHRLRQVEGAVDQTQKLCAAQGILLFEESNIPDEDQKAALTLLMKIDTACDRSVRPASEYRGQQTLLREALRRTKQSTPAQIESVLKYLMNPSGKVRVPKDPEVILRDFDRLQRFACDPVDL